MELNNILVIAGKPDLSEIVSQTKNGAIVKNLVTGQKYPVFRNDRISSLGEIRIYTNSGEEPLDKVMGAIYEKEGGKALGFDPKKVENKVLFDYFGEALPEYDKERVHASDVKKVLSWYNVLLGAGKLEPEEEKKEETEKKEEAEVKEEKKPAAKKVAAPKKAAAPKATAKPKTTTKKTTTAKKTV